MKNQINHIAFIMDGNNRWSKKNGKNKYYAYKKGASTLINLTNYIFDNTNVKYISAFALSKNNLNRSKNLIKTLKKILLEFLDKSLNENSNNFNIKFIGNRKFLSKEINLKIEKIEKLKIHSKKNLLIFINYSGRDDIEQAAYNLYRNKKNNSKPILKNYLLTKNIPDPDLLIRSGGFSRLSDFIIYQITFTELIFINKLWPDITKRDIFKILNKYYSIERKFGL